MTSLLTQAQRQQFTRFPKLDEHLLDATELNTVLNRRRDFNRLGYAVQLTVLKHLGRGLAAAEQPPKDVLIFLSEQLELDPSCWALFCWDFWNSTKSSVSELRVRAFKASLTQEPYDRGKLGSDWH